jgi:hypothetical protein
MNIMNAWSRRRRRQNQQSHFQEPVMTHQISAFELAASLPPLLSAVSDDAHRLAGLITPEAVGSGAHSYKMAEARRELELAAGHLSNAVVAFNRVSYLLKGLNNV